jgi:hypothetical protein
MKTLSFIISIIHTGDSAVWKDAYYAESNALKICGLSETAGLKQI